MGEFYVYIYYDPRTNPPVPIYVGLGRGNRIMWHMGRATNPLLKRKIAHIRSEGLEPLVDKVANDLDFCIAALTERELIAAYGRIDLGTGSLCNFTEGGEGTPGYKHRDETKALYSVQRRNKPQTEAQLRANRARTQTPEARARISASNKGRKLAPAHIAAIQRSNSERVISDATRQMWSAQRRGKKQTPEHVRKVVEARAQNEAELKASLSSTEWAAYKEQLYASRRGQKRSEKTKARMRKAWARRRAA